jgi:hypothetical protein
LEELLRSPGEDLERAVGREEESLLERLMTECASEYTEL